MPRKKRLADGFPKRLREARSKAGKTLQQVADESGLSGRAVISAMEQRAAPLTLKTIEDVATSLGVDPRWLAYGKAGE